MRSKSACPLSCIPLSSGQFHLWPSESSICSTSVLARISVPAASQIWIWAASSSSAVVSSYSQTWIWQRSSWFGPVEPTGLYGRSELAICEVVLEALVVEVEKLVGDGELDVDVTIVDDALVDEASVVVLLLLAVPVLFVLEAVMLVGEVLEDSVVVVSPVVVLEAVELVAEDVEELKEQACRLIFAFASPGGAARVPSVG